MRKFLILLFVLSLLVTACDVTDSTKEEVEVDVEKEALDEDNEPKSQSVETESESGVQTYSDKYLSFDYPSDLKLLIHPFGEGAVGEEITFIEWDETAMSYSVVGPGIFVSNEGGTASEEFEKNREENSQVVDLVGVEAYTTFNEYVMCEAYTSAHILSPYDFGEKVRFYGDSIHVKFTQVSVCPGDRYEEVLNLFLETVSF